VLIDTSSKPEKTPETEATKEDDINKVDSQGLTEADKQAIEDQADQKFNIELQSIFTKIIEKADFLVKLKVPAAYLFKDPSLKKQGSLL